MSSIYIIRETNVVKTSNGNGAYNTTFLGYVTSKKRADIMIKHFKAITDYYNSPSGDTYPKFDAIPVKSLGNR
jgi:hypothetical protein